jgi:hypothetical protein
MRRFPSKILLSLCAVAVTASVLTPIVLACVRPRTLDEQMLMAGDEVVVGRVVSIDERMAPEANGESVLWTVVRFHADESLVTNRRDADLTFFFRGGIRPGSPTTTITPHADDIREGRHLLLFLAKRPFGEQRFGAGVFQVDSYAEVYRVMDFRDSSGVAQEVVLGNGGGFALEQQDYIVNVRARVADAAAKAKKIGK